MVLTLSPQVVEIWQVFIPNWIAQKNDLLTLLNEEELQRANRFRLDRHRERFIIARAMLKKILNLYTNIPPEKIQFGYGQQGKPYLLDDHQQLQFNVSHSHDMAVYAIAQNAEIGIDIEKMKDQYKDSVAKRFFSEQEYREIAELPKDQRVKAFYQIWVKKEAIIKALGKGIFSSSDFSVHWDQSDEKIIIHSSEIHLHIFSVDFPYPVAVAVRGSIKTIQHWEWNTNIFKMREIT